MITLIRWYMMKAKEIKMRLAFWSLLEQLTNEIVENKEDIEKKLVSEIAKLVHESNQKNKDSKF